MYLGNVLNGEEIIASVRMVVTNVLPNQTLYVSHIYEKLKKEGEDFSLVVVLSHVNAT